MAYLDVDHYGTGVVELIQNEDGSYSLYFIGVFITEAGELHLYLSNKTGVSGSLDGLGNHTDLGEMYSFEGTFFFPIPININVSHYNSIILFCHLCLNIFTYAILS